MVKSINETIKFTEFCCNDPFDEIYNPESCFYHKSIKPRQFKLGNWVKAVRKNKKAYCYRRICAGSMYGIVYDYRIVHGSRVVSEWDEMTWDGK